MITQEQQKKGAELMQTLIQKAWDNPEFKNQLVKHPEKAISQVIDKEFKLPEEKRVVVEDQTDDSVIYLNIPQNLNLSDIELTEEQLKGVSGGIILPAIALGVSLYLGGMVLYGATH